MSEEKSKKEELLKSINEDEEKLKQIIISLEKKVEQLKASNKRKEIFLKELENYIKD